MREYSVELERYGGPKTRHRCPSCGAAGQFTRYVDTQTGEYLGDDVGKCNRIDKCSYHKTPKQYNAEMGNKVATTNQLKKMESEEKPRIDYIPMNLVNKTLVSARESNFGRYLILLFGEDAFKLLSTIYILGCSKEFNGKGTIFYQIDDEYNCRTGKTMLYDQDGRRSRNPNETPRWVHRSKIFSKGFNLEQCLFGSHLLKDYPNKPVAIVESEKTAMIATAFMPEFNWLATGGVTGAKWHEYSVYKSLFNKRVFLFPDYGFYNKAKGITCFDKWKEVADSIQSKSNCDITVSKVLEDSLDENDRELGLDIADFLVRQDTITGLAIDDNGMSIKNRILTKEWWDVFSAYK